MLTLEMIALLTFFSVTLLAWLIGVVVVSTQARKRAIQNNLPVEERAAMQGPLGQFKPFLQDTVAFLKRRPRTANYLREKKASYTELLLRSGNPGMLSGEEVIAVKLVLPFIFFLLVFTLMGASNWMFALGAAAFGFYMPDLKLRDLSQKRQQQIKEGLPDALDSFALMMRAGLDLSQSIDYYIDDPERDALQEEFYVMRAQMRLGKTRAQAIRTMAEKLNLEDFDTIATTVIQAERSGVSMTEFFNSQAEEVRDKRFQAAEEQGQKAPFKMMVPLMLFIMPGVGLILFAPMIIKYMTGDY